MFDEYNGMFFSHCQSFASLSLPSPLLLLLPWIEAVEERLLVNPEHPFQGGDGQSNSLQRYQWHLWIDNSIVHLQIMLCFLSPCSLHQRDSVQDWW